MGKARQTHPPEPVRRQPMVSPGSWQSHLKLWRYTVYLTPDEHAALAGTVVGDPYGAGPMSVALARIIDEGLSDALPEGDG